MKRGRGKDLQPTNDVLIQKKCATCEGVLPSIEQNDYEREAPVDSIEIAINFVKT